MIKFNETVIPPIIKYRRNHSYCRERQLGSCVIGSSKGGWWLEWDTSQEKVVRVETHFTDRTNRIFKGLECEIRRDELR